MKTQKDPAVYGLYFSVDAMKREDYSTRQGCRLGVVVIAEGDRIRNPSKVEYQSFDDLELRANWSVEHPDWGVDWEALYPRLFFVDLQEAKRYFHTLQRVDRVCSHFAIRPTTFGQFCVLLAKGLGITKFVVQRRAGGWSYDEGEHQIWPIADAQAFVDQKIDEMRAKEAATRAGQELVSIEGR